MCQPNQLLHYQQLQGHREGEIGRFNPSPPNLPPGPPVGYVQNWWEIFGYPPPKYTQLSASTKLLIAARMHQTLQIWMSNDKINSGSKPQTSILRRGLDDPPHTSTPTIKPLALSLIMKTGCFNICLRFVTHFDNWPDCIYCGVYVNESRHACIYRPCTANQHRADNTVHIIITCVIVTELNIFVLIQLVTLFGFCIRVRTDPGKSWKKA